MKVEDRYIRFVNNVTTTMSDEQMTKINFVDLEKLYNFVVEKFFHLNSFRASKIDSKKWFVEGQKNAHSKMPLCRVPEKKALGKDAFCRVPKKWHSAKYIFAECQNKGTRQRGILPSARKKALGKEAFCRVPKNGTRQNTSLLSAEKNTRQSRLCRVPDKIHSAKLPALGKMPVSDSDNYDL